MRYHPPVGAPSRPCLPLRSGANVSYPSSSGGLRARGGIRTHTTSRSEGFKPPRNRAGSVLLSVACAVVCGFRPCSPCSALPCAAVSSSPVQESVQELTGGESRDRTRIVAPALSCAGHSSIRSRSETPQGNVGGVRRAAAVFDVHFAGSRALSGTDRRANTNGCRPCGQSGVVG